MAITPVDDAAPTGRRLLAKLLDLQAAIPAAEGLSQEQICGVTPCSSLRGTPMPTG
ncbi:MAG: hypothetical protein ACO3ZD_10010 [Cyanobium sp.]